MIRYQYRITKYDPANRNEVGAYLKDDWSSHSDVGRTFSGTILTEAEYLKVEQTYLFAVEALLKEAAIDSLVLRGLENHRNGQLPSFVQPDAALTISQAIEFSTLVLREVAWGKLVVPGRAYVHFGYDYYMYVGLPSRCPLAITAIQSKGLFVESPFRSPYLRQRSKNSFEKTSQKMAGQIVSRHTR